MPSPFPGMDPYLEHPRWFPGLHDRLIVVLSEFLQAKLPAPYFAEIGRRLWVEVSRRAVEPDVQVRRANRPRDPVSGGGGLATAMRPRSRPIVVSVPHDERRETFVEIRLREDYGERVVAAIEVLSPGNKVPGEQGRELYLRKQRELIDSATHLIEIDLLRAGQHTIAVPRDLVVESAGPFDYLVSIHRFDRLEDFEVYPILLDDRLPEVAFPLLPGDPDVLIDFQAVFDRCYDTGPYRSNVGYGEEPIIPPLSAEQAAWAAQVIGGSAAESASSP
ncbi:MAG: hypothetical protein JWN86_3880 [Planctomycetota bacterium]|nr:hypothetical protein [Planctomycetota bacterium]